MSRKFILGYVPGTTSKVHPGPKKVTEVTAYRGAEQYHFERWQRDEHGLYRDVLRIYDSRDFPEDMLAGMAELKQILWLDEAGSYAANTGNGD